MKFLETRDLKDYWVISEVIDYCVIYFRFEVFTDVFLMYQREYPLKKVYWSFMSESIV